MATTLISLERQLQADGWWYSIVEDRWSRMWDDKMQYGKIRDGKFHLIYPEPVKIDESTVRVENGQVFATMAEPQKVVFSQVMDPNNFGATMADVGHIDGVSFHSSPAIDGKVWCEEQAYDRSVMPVLDNDEYFTLRDQFAMHAMGSLMMFSGEPKGLALRAYEYADAMMIARGMKR